jgi:hypothetical protein
MTREWLVAFSYPADDEFTRLNTGVLGGLTEPLTSRCIVH